jgi:acid phosphatase type 7
LQANQKQCTVGYFHSPLFSSGEAQGGQAGHAKAIWDLLYSYDADLVVNGDEHHYERFAPQDPEGVADSARGIRAFVVGTGGRKLREFGTTAQIGRYVTTILTGL